MARMTGPDCAVMCKLINTHTHTHNSAIFIFSHLLLVPVVDQSRRFEATISPAGAVSVIEMFI